MKSNLKGVISSNLVELILGLLIVLIFVAVFISGILAGDAADALRGSIGQASYDSDSDGTVDFQDDCPCTIGLETNNGCPEGYSDEDKTIDRQRYNNTDTGCQRLVFDDDGDGIENRVDGLNDNCPNTPPGREVERVGPRRGCSEGEIPETLTSEEIVEFSFIHYRSIEIFGDDDNEDKIGNSAISSACLGWEGTDCPLEDTCAEEGFYHQALDSGCWVMAVEDDSGAGGGDSDCGQAIASEGTVIPLLTGSNFLDTSEYVRLDVDLDNTFIPSQERDHHARQLFSWHWKSRPETGALVCYGGFWLGCREGGQNQNISINGQTFVCDNNEWVQQ